MILQLSPGGFDDNFSYIAKDQVSGEGFVIDPCGDTAMIINSIAQNRVKIKYLINTHGHNDHTEGNWAILEYTDAVLVIHKNDSCNPTVKNMIRLSGGEKLTVGNEIIEIMHTPGHTPGSICVRFQNGLFTGDTLFVDYCGYTCDIRAEYESLQKILRMLPDELIVYSGHNYGKTPFSLLGKEKTGNPYLIEQDFEAFCLKYKEL